MRTAAVYILEIAILASPACVVRLSERNEPLPNGGVSGPAADCRIVQPLPKGAPGGGAAETKFVGRYDVTDPAKPRFDWSGNYMRTRFEGTSVTWGIIAVGEDADPLVELVFEQVIDDGPPEQVVLGGVDHLKNEDGSYRKNEAGEFVTRPKPRSRAVTLPQGLHEITVMRSSEALFGTAAFVPFTFGPGTRQLPPTERPRRIEIIGDSITCGYGNEGGNATCPYDVAVRKAPAKVPMLVNGVAVQDPRGEFVQVDGEVEVKIPETQNIYLAYGSIAARNLSADIVTVCFSGKGVYQIYREPGFSEKAIERGTPKDPDAQTVIPQYYLRTFASQPASPAWDFATEPQPQVVVISLGQNDFGRDFDEENRKS